MFIKPLWDTNTYDIFLGKGWENWIRVFVTPQRRVNVVKKAEHVDPTPKLLELIFYKIRKQEARE